VSEEPEGSTEEVEETSEGSVEEAEVVEEPEVIEEPEVVEEVKEPEVVCPKCPDCGGDTAPTLVVNEIVTEFCCKDCGKRTN